MSTGPELSLETLGDFDNGNLNMKLCLGMANRQYGPLGLATSITIRLKTAVKDLLCQMLGWDDYVLFLLSSLNIIFATLVFYL